MSKRRAGVDDDDDDDDADATTLREQREFKQQDDAEMEHVLAMSIKNLSLKQSSNFYLQLLDVLQLAVRRLRPEPDAMEIAPAEFKKRAFLDVSVIPPPSESSELPKTETDGIQPVADITHHRFEIGKCIEFLHQAIASDEKARAMNPREIDQFFLFGSDVLTDPLHKWFLCTVLLVSMKSDLMRMSTMSMRETWGMQAFRVMWCMAMLPTDVTEFVVKNDTSRSIRTVLGSITTHSMPVASCKRLDFTAFRARADVIKACGASKAFDAAVLALIDASDKAANREKEDATIADLPNSVELRYLNTGFAGAVAQSAHECYETEKITAREFCTILQALVFQTMGSILVAWRCDAIQLAENPDGSFNKLWDPRVAPLLS